MSVKHHMHTFPMIWHFLRVVWLHLFHCWYFTHLYLKSQIIVLYFQSPYLNLQLDITPLSQNHYIKIIIQFSSVQSLSHIRLFATPWTEARQASLSITNTWSPPKPVFIVSVMPSNHLILCSSLLVQSFPASGSFPMSQLFASDGQSIGVSASTSVLPVNSHLL